MEKSFGRRGIPQELRDKYWRLHQGRRFRFRTSGGPIDFDAVASRGLPQSGPESPLLYAALVEDLIQETEDVLKIGPRRPAGVNLASVMDPHIVQRESGFRSCFADMSMVYINQLRR